MVLEPGSLSMVEWGSLLPGALMIASVPGPHKAKGTREFSDAPFIRALMPFLRGPALSPNHSSKAHFLIGD